MGIILLLILSVLLSLAFTQHARKQTELALSQVSELRAELIKKEEVHAFERGVWKNTVRELLQEVK